AGRAPRGILLRRGSTRRHHPWHADDLQDNGHRQPAPMEKRHMNQVTPQVCVCKRPPLVRSASESMIAEEHLTGHPVPTGQDCCPYPCLFRGIWVLTSAAFTRALPVGGRRELPEPGQPGRGM